MSESNCSRVTGSNEYLQTENRFASFWQAGFEGADHVNQHGQPLSMIGATKHLQRVEEDYRALSQFGIRTIRESIGWRLSESAKGFDFDHVIRRAEAAQRNGLQVLWTCCHYGIPEDLDYFDESFVARFVRFCDAAAYALKPYFGSSDYPRFYTPINEISFLAWAICESTFFSSKYRGRPDQAYALKMRLAEASLKGMEAIRSVDPAARFLHVDPLVHVVAPEQRSDLTEQAAAENELQFQTLDMLCGRTEPQLGGRESTVDVAGLNYYHSNQWEFDSKRCLFWHLNDPRRKSLRALLSEFSSRYPMPLALSETSHVGLGRGLWIEDVAEEIRACMEKEIPIVGVCLYPIVDRPEWNAPGRWHRSGLWDVDDARGELPRHLNEAYAASLCHAQRRIPPDPRFDSPNKEKSMPTLIVFSHLRWDFVYQRPQHLLTRMAKYRRVLFVEEPVFNAEASTLEILTPAPNVRVLRPHTPIREAGFHDRQIPHLLPALKRYLRQEECDDYSVWFYTPMALPLLSGLSPRAIFYDCMDELGAFHGAPPQLAARELTLMKLANAVFTGGPSLYERKRERSANVHCFPSSVDVAHFARGKCASFAHPLLDDIPHPRLGFFGVLDERLDLDLIAYVADARPQWHLCLVGPVAKIDPTVLPARKNIHYFPMQSYAALPDFLAGWDVCLLPFARNEATRFISPTKTLEYLAADKPVVSTDIVDVARLYADSVWVAENPERFVAGCEAALAGPEASRLQAMKAAVRHTSWDATANKMNAIVAAAEAEGLLPEAVAHLEQRSVVPMTGSKRRLPETAPCLIVGGGPTGLSAAYHFGRGSVLVEREARVGGWCRSIEQNGFVFDCAGHIMFSRDPHVLHLYRVLLGDNVHWQDREAWIYSKNVYTRYPFQGSLHGLPADVLKECLIGAIEARFGSLHPQRSDAAENDCCADGVAGIGDRCVLPPDAGVGKAACSADEAENFELFIHRVWGRGVAKHFAIPYNRKLWTVPLSEMETSWLGGRVPMPDLEEMIEGALQPTPKPMGPNARFGYPLRGGFQALMDGFLPHLQSRLLLSTSIRSMHPLARFVTTADGTRLHYRKLINTIPLPELIAAIGEHAPAEIHAAAAQLKHVSVRCVNLGIGRENITEKHWIYYPEDTIFHRIFAQGNASPHCNPPGGFGLTCEISYSPHKPLPCDGDELVRRCIDDCVRVGLIRHDDPILAANQVDMPYAYVVYDKARAAAVSTIRTWLRDHDIILAGRYAEWEYYNSDHAFLAGKRAATEARGDALPQSNADAVRA